MLIIDTYNYIKNNNYGGLYFQNNNDNNDADSSINYYNYSYFLYHTYYCHNN